MKRLQKNLLYIFIATAVTFTSCSPEDGADGMDGAPGEQGVAGQGGEDGEDGEDGNANVTGVTVDPFPSWTVGSYLGQEANFVEIDEPLLTEEVANDALILVYFKLSFTGDTWYPMTYAFPFDNGNEEIITYTYGTDLITIYALSSTGPLNAGISKVRYFIIPTSDTAGRSASGRDFKLQELRNNGVDVTNYKEVAAYFNLD